MRNMFIADEGNVLLEVDVVSAEVRVWGTVTKDPQLIEDLNSGKDIYILFASDVWRKSFDSISKESEERKIAKKTFLGTMYSMGEYTLAKECNIPLEEATMVMNKFWNRYRVAKHWLDTTIEVALNEGKIRNIFGRYRRFPIHLFNNTGEFNVQDVIGEIVNFPIQSASSDATQMIGVDICNKFKEKCIILNNGKPAGLVATLHDSLVLELKENFVEKALYIIKDSFKTAVPELIVPFQFEYKIGKKWTA